MPRIITVSMADLEGLPHGGSARTSVTVEASYTSEVVLTNGTIVPAAIKSKTLAATGVREFSIATPSERAEPYRNVGVRFTAKVQNGVGARKETRWERTVVMPSTGADPIALGNLIPAENVAGAQWTTVSEFAAEMTATKAAAQNAAKNTADAIRANLAADISSPTSPAYQALVDVAGTITDPQTAGLINDPGSQTAQALAVGITTTGTRPVGKGEITVSAADHGVSAQNATNSTALSAALAVAASRNVPLTLGPGVYKMSAFVEVPENADLRMDPGAVLDFGPSGASSYLLVRGGIDTTRRAVTAGAAKGSYTVTVDSHTFTAGSWIKVSSDDLYDVKNTAIPLGELVQVREVSGSTVTLWTPLRDTYTTNVRAQAVTMRKNVRISGGTIRGNKTADTGKTGLAATYVLNLVVDGTRFEDIDMRHIGINNCVNAWVRNCEFEWNRHSAMGYAVSFANATRDSGCTNSSFLYTRHALSTNNSTTGDDAGIVRRITFAFNRVENSAPSVGGGGGDAIDTHAGAEDVDILFNRVNGAGGSAVNVECPSARVIGNTVLDCGTNGISVHNGCDRDGQYIITNNTVRRTGAGWSGIRQSSGYTQTPGRSRGVVISNNYVESSDIGIRAGRNAAAPGTIRDDSITITGNTVRECTGAGIYVYRADNVSITSNSLWATGKGVVVERASYATVGPDSIRSWTESGFIGVDLIEVTYARVQPGAIRAGAAIGVRVASSCANMTVGATSHIFATTKLENSGPATVVVGA